MTKKVTIRSDQDFIISEAGRCVACNLCLPYCPTYQLSQVETESPRGRISLISAMASGQLSATDKLEDLLHHCLLCRACETHCPSSVSFARLMDKGRYLLRQKLGSESPLISAKNSFIDFILRNPESLRAASRFSWLLKLQPNSSKRKNGRDFRNYLASIQPHRRWQKNYPAAVADKQVSLFLGCVSRSMDARTLDDAIYVLNRTGFSVNIPQRQSCCGALSLHAGREAEALKMMKKNLQAFASDAEAETPIIHTASGCGMNLEAYEDYLAGSGFSNRVSEISHFVDSHWPDTLIPGSGKLSVMLHTPCSMANSSADTNAPFRLLSRFANIKVQPVHSPYNCCGAAGTKMLTDYTVSSSLRQPVLDQIIQQMPDMVLSTNIGCSLHLSEGLRKAGVNIPVRHPISLVADALRCSNEL